MSLTAQTISTFVAAFALCLAIQLPLVTQDPAPKGNSTIRGVVTYADTGRPVRYATVRARSDTTGNWAEESVTNRHGEFVIKNVPAGHYIVFVHSLGILEPSVSPGPGSFLARLRLSGEAFTETVVNGTDSVDVKVQAVRGGVITGRVVTEDDQPLADADIKLLKREDGKWAPVLAFWDRYSDQKIKTDPSGVYRVAGLDAGEYLVRVSENDAVSDQSQPEDGAYTNGFFMAAYYPAVTTVKEAQAVTVTEGTESNGVDIRMPERAVHTISGTVKFGPEDAPGASAELLVERADEIGYADVNAGVTTVRADVNGKWELRGVPTGHYSIRIGGSIRLPSQKPDEDLVVAVAPKRISVRVEDDDVVVPDIKLVQGSTISGQVTWDAKPPKNYTLYVRAIPASRLSAEADSERRSRNVSAQEVFTGHLGEDGHFWITGLPAGKYLLTLWGFEENKFYIKSVTRKGADLKQSPLKVGEESEIKDVVISVASDFATVEGQIARPEASPKLNLKDAVVILAPANDATRRSNRGLLTVQPDASGKFVVNCAPGEYFLMAVTSAEIKKLAKPIDEDHFKEDNQKFQRLKVKGGEKVKGLSVPVGVNK